MVSNEEDGEGNGAPLQYSCLENPMDGGAWWAAVHGVAKSQTRLNDFTFIFYCHALEKEIATHSSVLALRIPGTGEPGGLPSMGSYRVGHDWSDSAAAAADHYIYYCGQESLRRNGVAIMVNKRVWNAVLGCNLKNDRTISVRFQGKPFNFTVIQACAPTSNTEEAEVQWFYEDLQDLLELTPKKDVLFIIGDWNAKVGIKKHLG